MFTVRDSKNKVVKIGRGVWFRRSDMINSLLQQGAIKRNDEGYYWTDKEYSICQYTDDGIVSVPLNITKKKVAWKVPFNGTMMSRYGYRAASWVEPEPWKDNLKVSKIHNKYIIMQSTTTGYTYYMGYPDYARASAKRMMDGVLSATFQFVKYGCAYGIKVKDLWYI